MRRRNLIVTSDSDEEDGDGTATTASVASGGGCGSSSAGRPSNPSPLPVHFPSLSLSPSVPVLISDDDGEEEDVEEIQDPDGDSPFVDAAENISPPAPAPPLPPPAAVGTPTPNPAPFPAPTRTPTPTPPPSAGPSPVPPPFRTPIPTPPPFGGPSPVPPPFRTPTPTPPPSAGPSQVPPPFRTPTPTPPPAAAPTRTPTPTPPPAAHPRWTPPPSAMSGRLRPVDEFLLRRGLRLRPEWLESCAAGLPGFDGPDGAEAQARRCFEQFLFADMNTCGAGVLPEGVGSMHGALLDGPFVLQVDEIVNMSAPLRERYRGAHAGPKRCLKLSMTDGMQRIFGMEYRPIKDLEVLAPAGLKVVIRNVHIRRGLLMLVPEVVEILGGVVDDLEAARARLVSEVNKPPRGKRKQGGLPLSSRATLAAWPGSANVTNDGDGISLPAAVNSSHPAGLGNAPQVGRTTGTVAAEFVSRPVMVNIVQEQHLRVREINMQGLSTSRNNTGTFASIPHGHDGTQTVREEYVDPSIVVNNSHEQQRVQEVTMQEQATPCNRIQRSSTATPFQYDSNRGSHAVGSTGADDVEATQFSSLHAQEVNVQDLSSFRNNSETSASFPNGRECAQTIEEEYIHTSIMATNSHKQFQCVQDVTMQEQATVSVRTERRSSSSTTTPCEYDSDHHSHAIGDTGENDVEAAQTSILDDEINHAEHSIILSGENEKPFTYIISMIADWATRQDTETFIQGKIKGLITSVKSFQYRRCTEYELYVYIDDGSYISMALVDHNIVKNMLGLNPEEVTAALSGESMLVSTSEMKEILRGFQKFWVNCEAKEAQDVECDKRCKLIKLVDHFSLVVVGMMTIEFNKNSSLPIVRELTEGCSCSDAWLLRARLKTLYSRRRIQSLDDMDTTP